MFNLIFLIGSVGHHQFYMNWSSAHTHLTKMLYIRGIVTPNISTKFQDNPLKACAQRFRYELFAFIHTQTYFEYSTLTLRLASLVKKAVIYAYWTMELFDICRENVSYMATLPSVARHVIHADNLRPRH